MGLLWEVETIWKIPPGNGWCKKCASLLLNSLCRVVSKSLCLLLISYWTESEVPELGMENPDDTVDHGTVGYVHTIVFPSVAQRSNCVHGDTGASESFRWQSHVFEPHVKATVFVRLLVCRQVLTSPDPVVVIHLLVGICKNSMNNLHLATRPVFVMAASFD